MINTQELLATLFTIVIGFGLGAFGLAFIVVVIRSLWEYMVKRRQ